MNIIKTVVYSTILVTASTASYANVTKETAPAFVTRISDNLVKRLVKDKPKYKKDSKVLYKIVQQNIEPYVDFAAFSRGVMGKYYRRATPEQRQRFQQTFKKNLLKAYSKYLGTYDNQSYTLKPFKPHKDPKKAYVTMHFKSGNGDIVPITYQMTLGSKGWKIRNVKAAGIDIGLTFRKQFQTAMGKNKNNLNLAIQNFLPKAKKP